MKELNTIIRGWCQYYTSAVSSKIFNLLDDIMFKNSGNEQSLAPKQRKVLDQNTSRSIITTIGDLCQVMECYLIKHKDNTIKGTLRSLGPNHHMMEIGYIWKSS
ncbi:MAG: group II intron maturase-specific domain-containing protein [Wolbachia sp.]